MMDDEMRTRLGKIGIRMIGMIRKEINERDWKTIFCLIGLIRTY